MTNRNFRTEYLGIVDGMDQVQVVWNDGSHAVVCFDCDGYVYHKSAGAFACAVLDHVIPGAPVGVCATMEAILSDMRREIP